jgi:hypothetical protein
MSESPPRELEGDRAPDRAPVPVRERADGYFRNGVWVPRGSEPDPDPPGWRERLESRLRIRLDDRRLWAAAAGVLVVIVILVAVAHRGGPVRTPEQERAFLEAVARGQAAVRKGNDLTVVTAERDRRSEVCPLLAPTDGAVHDWIGTVGKVGTVLGGDKGHAQVKIADDVTLKTWSRQSEDEKDQTLVDPNSDVYRTFADLKRGDEVRFTGKFLPDGSRCLHETSLFDRNGMLTPGFVFRFTAVAPR